MKHLFKIIMAFTIVILVLNQCQFKQNSSLESSNEEYAVEANSELTKTAPTTTTISEIQEAEEFDLKDGDYLVNDSLYRWDPGQLNWIAVAISEKVREQPPSPTFTSHTSATTTSKPIVIDWPLLLDIEYKAKYYEEFEIKMYAPVFPETLKSIDGKEVIIEGFVIPFDESGEIVALSANPFASCFFCGKASPASVISLYLKKKKLYKMDDYRKFRGVLKLNYDDPEEYYYILQKAVPLK